VVQSGNANEPYSTSAVSSCITPTARAGNRHFGPLSTLRAHTKAPYKMDFHRKTLRALNRPEAARTVRVLLAVLDQPVDRRQQLLRPPPAVAAVG
jgi:hypothetical protein